MSKEDQELERADAWDFQRAERRRPTKKARAVVSVAFNREDFERVAGYAGRAGMKVSEFIRKAALARASGQERAAWHTAPTAGGDNFALYSDALPPTYGPNTGKTINQVGRAA